eukprot:COSAG06_NODE_1277_length_10034_cov_2.246200_1_plen_1034_part_10
MTCNPGRRGASSSYGGGSCLQCPGVTHCAASQCTGPHDATCQSGRCDAGFEADASCGPSACDSAPSDDNVAGGCAGHHTGDTCATFTCETGYKPHGTYRCGTDGHWTGGSCTAQSCAPLTPDHAAAPVTGDYGRRSYALQCLPGYFPKGTMRCVWQGGHGVFTGATCDECDAIARCPISLGGLACTRSGDSTCSQCEAGYIPTEPTPTACIGMPCEDDPAPAHGQIVSSGASPLRYPSTVGFRCEPGYVLSDEHNRTCTTSGGWSSHFPTCIETCDTSPCHNGATCTDDGNLAGGKGQFQCTCPSESGKPFWEGERCDKNVNECSLDLTDGWALNGGCDYDEDEQRPLAQCVNETGGFHCGQCLGVRDCCHQAAQANGHQLPCGGSDVNMLCRNESSAWTELGCIGPATAAESSFVILPLDFVAGDHIAVHVDPRDVNKRLSADNGITSASGLQGTVVYETLPNQPLDFMFNASSLVYVATMLETVAGAYRVNVSVRDQLSSLAWQEIQLPSVAEFHVVPAPADASNTVFGGCYFGTSDRSESCYCVDDGESRGCRTLPGVHNHLTIIVRDQYSNVRDPTVIATITKPARQHADEVTASVVGSAAVQYEQPHWEVAACDIIGNPSWSAYCTSGAQNSSSCSSGCGTSPEAPPTSVCCTASCCTASPPSSYAFTYFMASQTEHSYTLTVSVNGEVAETIPVEYIFHTSFNKTKCDDLRCHEFYEPSRFSNYSRWTTTGSTLEQDCRAAGCLFFSEPNDQANTLAITLADPLQPNGALNLSVVGLCLMKDSHYNPNDTFVSAAGKGFCMGNADASPDDPTYCNDTRLDCFGQDEIVIGDARSSAKATEYEVDFRVPHPGFYGFSVGMHDGAGTMRHNTEPLQLLVGPGQPNRIQSSFSMLTNRHDSKEGNKLRFEVLVVDSDGDPRFGLDEVIVELTRLPAADVDPDDQKLQPTDALTMRLMTEQSRQHAGPGSIGLIHTGSRDGRYVVEQTFATEGTGSKGVFRMRVWVCPPRNGTACAQTAENEVMRPNVPSSE